ncbi:MAG: DUF3047 domain-containing protein [Elusimicrobiota bacterium]|nr:DUF3047 domain-containing protein [Elusimicrobiota bacterium]
MHAAVLTVLLSSAPLLGPAGLPSGWEPLSFAKRATTAYEWSPVERALHAKADASASGLIVRFKRPVAETPVLRWRWKVAGTLPEGDERRKSGDDYAARVYVAFIYDPARASAGMRFKYGLAKRLRGEYPPHAAINYIWANKLDAGRSVPNAYSDRVMMVAVRSGDGEAGSWRAEERDVLADYRRLFGEEPPPYAGIAVMTDADDTRGTAEAWYADLTLSAR